MGGAAAETQAIDKVLVEVNDGTVDTHGSAGNVPTASKSVETAANELRKHVESF